MEIEKKKVQEIIEGQIRVARELNMPDYNLATMLRAELELTGYINYEGYDEIRELTQEIAKLKKQAVGCEHAFIGLPKDFEIYGHKCHKCGLIMDTGL